MEKSKWGGRGETAWWLQVHYKCYCFLLSNFLKFSQYYHQLFYSIQFLRHLKEFFGVMFKIQAQQSDDDNSVAGGESKILLSCVGAGYTNINKTMV